MFNFDKDRHHPQEKFTGMYRGVVEDVADPKKVGRVRVRVFTIFDDVEVEHLPWAIYADPMMGGSRNSGGMIVPANGDHVWVFFENGDHMQPVYFAGAPSAPHFPETGAKGMPEKRGEPEYPFNKVIETKAGHTVEIDDTEGNTRIRVKHKSGTQYIMYDDGDLYEYVVGDHKRFVLGSVEEHITGDCQIFIGGTKIENIGGDSLKKVSGLLVENSGSNRVSTSGGATTINSSGTMILQTNGQIDQRGSEIHLNSYAPSPASPQAPDSPTIPPLED